MRLRVILIEDAAADAELITRELQASGFSYALTQVKTEREFRHELAAHPPDLILSDHGLPSFSGFRALEIVQEEHLELPFIFVSGSNDPSMVAHMYEAGATDYVFKHDLEDLIPAVLRALEARTVGRSSAADDDAAIEQPELGLQLPPPDLSVPAMTVEIGDLLFCPRCRKVRNEAGNEVELTDYCSRHAEVLVHREICAGCARQARSN